MPYIVCFSEKLNRHLKVLVRMVQLQLVGRHFLLFSRTPAGVSLTLPSYPLLTVVIPL